MGCPIWSAILPSSGYSSTISVSAATEKKKLWILFGNCKELERPAKDEISTRSVVFFFNFCKPCVKNAFPPKETSYEGKVKLSYNFLKTGHSILYFLHSPITVQSHPTHMKLLSDSLSCLTWREAFHQRGHLVKNMTFRAVLPLYTSNNFKQLYIYDYRDLCIHISITNGRDMSSHPCSKYRDQIFWKISLLGPSWLSGSNNQTSLLYQFVCSVTLLRQQVTLCYSGNTYLTSVTGVYCQHMSTGSLSNFSHCLLSYKQAYKSAAAKSIMHQSGNCW